MPKPTFPLLIFACIPICACQTQTSSPVPAPTPSPPTVFIEPQEQATFPTPPTDLRVWDVENADVSKIDTNRKLLAFTYDDAPASTLESVMAVFLAYNESNPDCVATATLFCNGFRIDEHVSSTLRTALALGFELGNHTYSHADLSKCTADEITCEIDKTDRILQRFDHNPRHLFRAPYGKITDQVRSQVQTPIIDWTIDTLDWTGKSADEIYDCVWSQKYAGAIVLMHDGYPNTAKAMKRLLPDLKNAGYQAVTVSQLAKIHGCKLQAGNVYIRARKQK